MTVDHAGMMPALHLQFRQLYYDGLSRWHDACIAVAVVNVTPECQTEETWLLRTALSVITAVVFFF